MKTTTTPTCRICGAEASPENPVDFHSDCCCRCIEKDERAMHCALCGGTILDAESGSCCIALVECACGNLVEGDGTPTCDHCDTPLCDACRVDSREFSGGSRHRDLEVCKWL